MQGVYRYFKEGKCISMARLWQYLLFGFIYSLLCCSGINCVISATL